MGATVDNLSELIASDSSRFTIQWIVNDLKTSGIQRIIRYRNPENKLQCIILESQGNRKWIFKWKA